MSGIDVYKRQGYIHAVKIGTTLKIPKISVINYVMEKEVKKVG